MRKRADRSESGRRFETEVNVTEPAEGVTHPGSAIRVDSGGAKGPEGQRAEFRLLGVVLMIAMERRSPAFFRGEVLTKETPALVVQD